MHFPTMYTNPVVIVALSLPSRLLSLSIGAVGRRRPPSQDDDFLPLYSVANSGRTLARCSFTQGEISYFSTYIMRDEDTKLKTSLVVCENPDKQDRTYISYSYGPPSYLKHYSPDSKTRYHFLDETVGLGGFDPLEALVKIDNSTALKKAHNIPVVEDPVFVANDGESRELEKLCLEIKDAIKAELGTFRDVCNLYRQMADSTVTAARQENWEFRDKPNSQQAFGKIKSVEYTVRKRTMPYGRHD